MVLELRMDEPPKKGAGKKEVKGKIDMSLLKALGCIAMGVVPKKVKEDLEKIAEKEGFGYAFIQLELDGTYNAQFYKRIPPYSIDLSWMYDVNNNEFSNY